MNGVEVEKENAVTGKNEKQLEVLMSGYFPGVTAQRTPLTSPAIVRFPEAEVAGDSWKDVCPGGCGFGVAISASGKLITWGSADDQGQSYLTSGKHGETPQMYPLPTTDPIIKAAAGWAHCVSVTDKGEVYTWGWKECIPSVKITRSWTSVKSCEDETATKRSSTITESGPVSCPNDTISGDETTKRRKVANQQEYETPITADETLSMPPCLVNLDPGVKIMSVAAGGRHTLALSDGVQVWGWGCEGEGQLGLGSRIKMVASPHLIPCIDPSSNGGDNTAVNNQGSLDVAAEQHVGQVWGWGYGGEGQLGLGSRIKMVASPHLIPCIDPSSNGGDNTAVNNQGSLGVAAEQRKSIGNHIKEIACGGRHSVVVTDTGVLLAFGWGLYGQCGQGNTDDLLRPTCVPSLMDSQIEAVAAGLWHTICICADGRIHAFGGNQFGQLGLGTSVDQCEIVPRLLDASVLENKKVKKASSGARHTAILTEDGKIFCWGWNKYGQLGVGDTVDRSTPAEVPLTDYTPKNIACGWWHTLLLCETIPSQEC